MLLSRADAPEHFKKERLMSDQVRQDTCGREQPGRHSRRRFLAVGVAAAGGGALALATGRTPSAFADTTSDIEVLNYALTLEHLEAAFYNQGAAQFSSKDFFKFGVTSNIGPGVSSNIGAYVELVRMHENTHVAALTQVITSLGGTPVGAGTYNFPYSDVSGFLRIAMALENTGVSAYDGAIHFLADNPDLLTTGATIATVEARHAAYFNLLNGVVPFPSAFDTPLTPQQVYQIASQFIVSIPPITLP